MTRGILMVLAAACIAGCAGDEGAAGRIEGSDSSSMRTPARTSRADSGATTSRTADAAWTATTGEYVVEWSKGDITASRASGGTGRPFLSIRAALDTAMDHGIPMSEDTAGVECNEEYDIRVLSVVGHILSIEQRHYSYCQGLPHPSIYTGYHAIDLRRTEREGVLEVDGSEHLGRELSLTDLFPDREVLDALLADKLVQKRLAELAGGDPAMPSTTEELAGLLEGGNECEYSFEPDLLHRFAFHHVEGDRVAVRLGLSHGCEAAQGMLTQIGILLKIPDALRGALQAAANGNGGILMHEASKQFGKRAAHFEYTYSVDDMEGVD